MMENRESFTLAPVIAIVEPASDLRRISADVRVTRLRAVLAALEGAS